MASKERPILFSAAMVRAILEGRKTMTRRVVKPQPVQQENGVWNWKNSRWGQSNEMISGPFPVDLCPYGQPGDRLWVRETYRLYDGEDDCDYGHQSVGYRADHPDAPRYKDMPWSPSIFMPRWASRITLELTDVRVEKLQQITKKNALREGVYEVEDPRYSTQTTVNQFKKLWDFINGKKYPWSSNPFVWVLTFKLLPEAKEEI